MMTAMQKDFKEDVPSPDEPENNFHKQVSPASTRTRGAFTSWINRLVQMGLGESILRAGTNLFSILAIVIVIWLVQMFYRQTPSLPAMNAAQASIPAATSVVDINSIPAFSNPAITGISRAAQIHTNIPSRARAEITKYDVQKGDTVNGIADKFGSILKRFLLQISPCFKMTHIICLPVRSSRFCQQTEFIGSGSEEFRSAPGQIIFK